MLQNLVIYGGKKSCLWILLLKLDNMYFLKKSIMYLLNWILGVKLKVANECKVEVTGFLS